MRRLLIGLGLLVGVVILALMVMLLFEIGAWVITIGVTLALIGVVVLIQWLGRSSPAVGGAPAVQPWLPGWLTFWGTLGVIFLLVGFLIAQAFIGWGKKTAPETAKARIRTEVAADFRQRVQNEPVALEGFKAAVKYCGDSEAIKEDVAVAKLAEAKNLRATGWSHTVDPGAPAEQEAFESFKALVKQGQDCRTAAASIFPDHSPTATQVAVASGLFPLSQPGVYVMIVVLFLVGAVLAYLWRTLGGFVLGLGKFLMGAAVCLVLIMIAIPFGKWVVVETGLDTMLKGFDGTLSPGTFLLIIAVFVVIGLVLAPFLRPGNPPSTGGHP